MIKKIEKNKDLSKIKEEILNLKKSLINFNFQKSTGQLEKTAIIRKTRRNIAQLKTQYKQVLIKQGAKNA
tara:strand:+ start:294 stop:503 length:210 start_codon:yes stop_codon:yes gene_type:complete